MRRNEARRREVPDVLLGIAHEPVDIVEWADRYVAELLNLEALPEPRRADPPLPEATTA